MQFTINLEAGKTYRQQTAGAYFLIMDTGAASSIDVRLFNGTTELEHVTTAKRGLKARMPNGQQFNAIDFTPPVDCAVTFVISTGAVDIDATDGSTVMANILGLPLPVSNDRGAPGNPVYVNTALAGLPAATAIVNDAAVPVTAANTAVVDANANRIRLIFTNVDAANAVAVGGAGLTWAKRAIVLQPGDSWIEERAANLAWTAICDVGLTASLGVQEVTA